MVTEQGLIKRVGIDKFSNVRRSGLIALRLNEGDQLQWVKLSSGKDDVVLVSADGQAIRFKEKDVREMGRNAAGVRGMRLKGKDTIVGMDVLPDGEIQSGEQLLVVMSKGYGKRTSLKEYKVQGRGGSGIKTANITDKTGEIRAVRIISSKQEGDAIIISKMGQVIRLPLKSVSVLGRATQGVRLMRFKENNDELASMVLL
jgi:DNA gyrase subunit A